MQLPWLKVLSEQEIQAIHNASLDILQQCGVRILNDRMLAFLKDRGLAVDDASRTVTFTRACIEDALSHVPAQFGSSAAMDDSPLSWGTGDPRSPRVTTPYSGSIRKRANAGNLRWLMSSFSLAFATGWSASTWWVCR